MSFRTLSMFGLRLPDDNECLDAAREILEKKLPEYMEMRGNIDAVIAKQWSVFSNSGYTGSGSSSATPTPGQAAEAQSTAIHNLTVILSSEGIGTPIERAAGWVKNNPWARIYVTTANFSADVVTKIVALLDLPAGQAGAPQQTAGGVVGTVDSPDTGASLQTQEALTFLTAHVAEIKAALLDALDATEIDALLADLQSHPALLAQANPQVFSPVLLASLGSSIPNKNAERLAVCVDVLKATSARNLLNSVTGPGSNVNNIAASAIEANMIKNILPMLKLMADAERKGMAMRAKNWIGAMEHTGIVAAGTLINPLVGLGTLYLQATAPVVRALRAPTAQQQFDILKQANLIDYAPGDNRHPGKLVVINSGHRQIIGETNVAEDGAQYSYDTFAKEGYEVLHFRVGLGYDPFMKNTNDFLTIAQNVTTSRLVKAGPFGPASTVTEIEMEGYSWGGGQASRLIASIRASTDPAIRTLPINLALIDAVALGDTAFLGGPALSERPDVQSLFNRYELQGNATVGSFVLQIVRDGVMADMAEVLAGATFVGPNYGIPSSLFRKFTVIEMKALLDQFASPFTQGNPAHGVGFVKQNGDDQEEVFKTFDPNQNKDVDVNHLTIDDQLTKDPGASKGQLSVTEAAIAFLMLKAR